MLEILLLRVIYKKLAAIAEGKNRARAWAWLGVVFWIGGEIIGVWFGSPRAQTLIDLYVVALVGAVLGGASAFAIVSALGARPLPDFPTATIHKA